MKYLPQILILITLATTPVLISAQDNPFTVTKAQALEDLKWLRFALEYCHPRLYKYDEKSIVDARFDSLNNLIGTEITGTDFLSHVSAMNASVHCGHLYTIPQGRLAKEVLGKKVMPFYIKLIDNKIYLLHNCSNNEKISNGSVILSINGRSSAEILAAILPIVAADGYIETRKRKLIERYFYYAFNGFDLYYYLRVDRSNTFKIEYIDHRTRENNTAILEGIPQEKRQHILNDRYNIDELNWFKKPSPTFEFNKDRNYAVLTVSRSFYDKNIDPNYDSVLSNGFSALKERKITNLIIDLRGNEGGSEHQQSDNYDYYEGLQLRLPQKNVFTGNLYVLMNGGSFSSTSALIANIKNTTKAIFIGEESGGTYEGPTGGQTIPIVLPNSGIMVRMSPNINIGYMYQKHPVGRGVFPDYPASYRIGDVLVNRDLEMEIAKDLIRKVSKRDGL